MAKVLVIDDETEMRATIAQLLASAGHDVVLAAGGKEGLEKYRINPPDLVLVDLFMPELDGFETIGLLHREFPEAKIVAMSGNIAADAMLSVARRLGCAAVLEKPFTLEQLLVTLEKVV